MGILTCRMNPTHASRCPKFLSYSMPITIIRKHAIALAVFFTALTTGSVSLAQEGVIPSMKIEEVVKQYQTASNVMVVNFWSTWCKPCIEEIPYFISVTNEYKDKGVHLLLVSEDTKTVYRNGKLKRFIEKKKWKTNFAWLNETNADHYCPLVDSSWSGVIPATVIINPPKGYYRFFEASLSAAALEAEIKKAMGE